MELLVTSVVAPPVDPWLSPGTLCAHGRQPTRSVLPRDTGPCTVSPNGIDSGHGRHPGIELSRVALGVFSRSAGDLPRRPGKPASGTYARAGSATPTLDLTASGGTRRRRRRVAYHFVPAPDGHTDTSPSAPFLVGNRLLRCPVDDAPPHRGGGDLMELALRSLVGPDNGVPTAPQEGRVDPRGPGPDL
ncbi:hypothetical protein GCM10022227_36220 [Streptomyces sedi]